MSVIVDDEKVVGCIDTAAKRDCYAVFWSYGEICVGCGCCSKDPLMRTKARVEYNEDMLNRREHFDGWIDDDAEMRAIQEKNVKADITYYRRALGQLRRRLKELEARKLDELISKRKAVEYMCIVCEDSCKSWEKGWRGCYQTDRVLEEPPVDAAKVESGRWIWDREECAYYCEACGKYVRGETLEVMEGRFKFCPYCGVGKEELDED